MRKRLDCWFSWVVSFLCLFTVHQFCSAIPLNDRALLCGGTRVSERDIANAFFKESVGWQRPISRGKDAIHVNVSLTISTIAEIHERDRMMRFIGHVGITWKDEFHAWRYSFPHSCIDYIALRPGERVWIPDLALPLTEAKNTLTSIPGERVRIYSDGTSIFNPGGLLFAPCRGDLSYFPFDFQKCVIRIESWSYTTQYLRLGFSISSISMRQFSENELWRVITTQQVLSHAQYNETNELFDRAEFVFIMRRKSSFFVYSLVLPNLLLSVALLSVFSLPLEEVLRLQIAFTCLVAHAIYQTILYNDLPRSSDNYPLLYSFLELQMFYAALLLAVQAGVFAFLYKIVPEKEAQLEASLAIPLKFYNTACAVGKILRIEPPYDMIVSNTLLPGVRKTQPLGVNLSLPTNSLNQQPVSEKLSAASANFGSMRNEPIRPQNSSNASFWKFCPFISNNTTGNSARADGLTDMPDGDMQYLDLTRNGTIPSNATNNTTTATSTSNLNTGAITAHNLFRPESSTRILVEFRRRILRFYAHVIDRTMLFLYLCCIILTCFFTASVSSNTWRDNSK